MAFDPSAPAVLMTVKGSVGPPALPPSIEGAAAQLNLPIDELDPQFGVVMVSPHRGLYSVRINAAAIDGGDFNPGTGPYSDPKIEPMR